MSLQQEIVLYQMDLPTEQDLIACLRTHYAIDVVRLTPLTLGADPNALTYKGLGSKGLVYFIKLKTQGHDDLAATLVSLLYDAGIKQVIPPIKTKDQKSAQALDRGTLIVYPFVEGENGFQRPLTNEQWIALGKTMHAVHQFKLPKSLQLKAIAYSPKWQDRVRALYPYMASPPQKDPIACKLFTFMQAHESTIHRLVDRAEFLAQKVQKQAHAAVLCHSDLHGGNVLIDQNGQLFIVDWDEPVMAPKERDLMFIGGGVANVWNQPHESAHFYEGYGEVEIDRMLLAYYRHERIVEDIAIYGHALLSTTVESTEKATMCQHFIDMFEPQGVIDVAFQTDEAFE